MNVEQVDMVHLYFLVPRTSIGRGGEDDDDDAALDMSDTSQVNDDARGKGVVEVGGSEGRSAPDPDP